MAELARVRGIENTSEAFRRELFAVARRLDASANALAAVMSFETAGSFDPGQKNLGGGRAIGLIQFMPNTADKLGTSSAELAAMSDVEQLAYVEKYLAPAAGRLRTTSDHYMAVFAPVGIGRPLHWALPYKGRQYKANSALDRDKDGKITVGEASAPVIGILAAAMKRPPIMVDESSPLTPLASKAPARLPGGGKLVGKLSKVALVAVLAYAGAKAVKSRKEP